MRKKLFAILMSAMMMVTFMPSMAFAGTVNEEFPNGTTVGVDLTSYAAGAHGTEAYKTETIVKPNCYSADKYVKTTYKCGDFTVTNTNASKAHNYVVREMEVAEAKALVTGTAKGWLSDLVKGGYTNIDTNDWKSFIESVSHLLLGVSDTDKQIAKEAITEIEKVVNEYQQVSGEVTGNAAQKAFAGVVASVGTIINDYFVELDANVRAYLSTQTQADKAMKSTTYCYFLVKYCDKCGAVAKVAGYKHSKPADMADCATSYVCTHCNKTITVAASHFQQDAAALIEQAQEVLEYTPATAKVNVDWEDLSVLANQLFFADSTGHKLSVTKEAKTCGTVYTVACSKCGESVRIALPTSLKHNYEWKTLKAANCAKVTKEAGRTGLKVQVCADCGAVNLLTMTEVEAKHEYVEKTYAPTCTLPGYTVKVCKNCDNEVPVTSKAFVAPTGHDYEIKMLVEPACGGNGLLKIGCKTCGKVQYYTSKEELDTVAVNVSSLTSIKKINADEFFKDYVAGKFEGIVKVVDLLHSSPDNGEIAKYYFVGYAGELLKNPVELTDPSQTGHKYTTWGIQSEATCGHGTIWAPKCSVCGHVDAHAANYYLFEDEASQLSHNYKSSVVEANCEHKAGTIEVCQLCGKTNYYDTKGYSLTEDQFLLGGKCISDNEWVTIVEPTFNEVGMRVTHCVRCGGIVVREDVDKLTLGKAYAPKLTAGSKKITVKINKTNKNAKGYQIAYKVKGANNYKFVKITGTSKTIKNLKKGTKYAVKVRPYTTEAGKTFYGKYSTVKYVTVK